MDRSRKKLSLRTDTIRVLDAGELPGAHGGVRVTKPTLGCPTMAETCTPPPPSWPATMCC